jgi:segregation and condensation protein B
MNLESKLEALLFWKGEPMAVKKIAEVLACTTDELNTATTALETNLSTRGLRLMRHEGELELRTAPEASDLITALTKDELMRDLGKAGLETLSIILYKGPVKRSEIDYIRGVNSSFILRNLLVRGLVERIAEKDGDKRGFLYEPSMELIAHLGVTKREDLPDYDKTRAELEAFSDTSNEA